MSKIRITDTSLRDGHQSLWATRMATADMLPVLEKLDNIGYHSLEIWGGPHLTCASAISTRIPGSACGNTP